MKLSHMLACLLSFCFILTACNTSDKTDKTNTDSSTSTPTIQSSRNTKSDSLQEVVIILEDEQSGKFTFEQGEEFKYSSELAGTTAIHIFTQDEEPPIAGIYIPESQKDIFKQEIKGLLKQTREKDKIEYWTYDSKSESGAQEYNYIIHFPASKMYFYLGGETNDKAKVDRIFNNLTFYYTVDKEGKIYGG